MRSHALLLTLLLVSVLALGACGKKGEPDPPDKNQSVYPRTYPSR
jgi:predicted small lipoprotein YifL